MPRWRTSTIGWTSVFRSGVEWRWKGHAMQFEILGPLRVRSRKGELELGTPVQRRLLAVLLTSPNVAVSVERLIEELWGDDAAMDARHLLQVYVSRLRGVLGELPDGLRIVRDGTGYALRVRRRELDAERFVTATERARKLRDPDPSAAEHVLATAMRLWRGAPFADLPEVPPAVRDLVGYLERQHLEAQETWVDIRLQLGQHRELIPELAALVGANPYNETLSAHLMLAQYRSGHQGDALETARALATRLREDLGVDPSQTVGDLYRDILLQAPHLAVEPPDPPGNLPHRLTSFVGRTLEVREVAELVGSGRLVTLTGPGGVGKTRLALEVARQLGSRFPAGVWWIDLDRVTDPDAVPEELAGVLGLAPTPGTEVLEALARALGRRRALLLFDNCEHLVSAVGPVVASVLERTTGPSVLAASRTPLRIEGERLWAVPPLSLPTESGSLPELVESDAVRLFVERGRAVDPSFALDPDNAAAVAEVCRRLDGLSLAIEMAAARLRILTPSEIARRLDDRFALLELRAAGGSDRHRTLEAALDASSELLPEDERAFFERLSVFGGSFDLDAAAAVGSVDGDSTDPALEAVTSLVDASLLTPERQGGQTRYRLLETLREYALARLRDRGAEDEVWRAHAEYHLGLAARAGATLGTPDFTPWVQRLAQSYVEIRQALGWSLAHQDRAVTLRAAPALRELWYRRGQPREAGRWSARMLEGDLGSVPPSLLAEVHIAACFAADLVPDAPAALAHAEEAERLAREAADTRGLVVALWGRAQVGFALGDLDAVRRCATEALDACERHGDRWLRAGPLTTLGWAALLDGSPGRARAWLEEALPLYRELGDLGGIVLMTLVPLSSAALRQKDVEAAEGHASEAVELSRDTGWEAPALVCYGEALSELGDPVAAEGAATRALRIALASGLEPWFRMALRSLVRTAAAGGRWEDAAVLLGACRRDMPAHLQDPAVYGPIEERCRDALGRARFDLLVRQGTAMTHDELVSLAGVEELRAGATTR